MAVESQVTTPDISKVLQYVLICDPNGEEIDSHHGHLKVLGLHESIGHGTTNTDLIIERAMGRKTTIGTGAFTLLEEAAFVQPAGDTQMYAQSASANDTAAGTGVQQITIEYFSLAWGAKKTTTFEMTGAAQVTLPVTDIYRIHKLYADRAGSGGVAAGLITITNQAETALYGQISQYAAFMQRCIFYVAEGEKITCTEGIFGASTTGGVIGRLFASEENASGDVVPRARIIFEVANSQITYPFQISETASNPNNKRIAIGLAVNGKIANQTGTGSLKGFNEVI